jgi:hypothetical protein
LTAERKSYEGASAKIKHGEKLNYIKERKSIALFEGSQALLARPGKVIMKLVKSGKKSGKKEW